MELDGKRSVMLASNDYLGLSRDPRVLEASIAAMRKWGTGPGGSRFLCGNTTLHEALEERLAAFVGKKKAIVHTTGFGANLGSLSCLSSSGGFLVCDKENHASIFEGCRASRARVIPFEHNSVESAAERLAKVYKKHPEARAFLITEGVFSMSGDLAILPQLVELKKEFPQLLIYLDDAHGLGVMHSRGRGTPAHFGVTPEVDFLMGTFSKALASIGGFIASDDEDALECLKHQSRTLIFSAALPVASAATALASLEILEQEPERLERLHKNAQRARAGYREIGLPILDGETPIIPIPVGSEIRALYFARELLDNGIFALPAVYPAVPRGQAIIRTAFMATHEEHHIDFVLETLHRLSKKQSQAEESYSLESLSAYLNYR
jgi:glycine C-acetyltransferase